MWTHKLCFEGSAETKKHHTCSQFRNWLYFQMKYDCMQLGFKHIGWSNCLIVAVYSIVGRDKHLKRWHLLQDCGWSWLTCSWMGIPQTSRKLFFTSSKNKNKTKKPSLTIQFERVFQQRLLFCIYKFYHSWFRLENVHFCLDLCTRQHEADAVVGNSNTVEALPTPEHLAQVWGVLPLSHAAPAPWGNEAWNSPFFPQSGKHQQVHLWRH